MGRHHAEVFDERIASEYGGGDVYWVDAAVIHALKGTSLRESTLNTD